MTLRGALLVLIAFILAHHLTSEAVEDLLKVMGLLLPLTSTLPKTSYFLKRYFKQHTREGTFFVYCPLCQSLLGKDKLVMCHHCEKQFRKKTLIENGNYFVTMSIGEQLKNILDDDDLKKHIKLNRNTSDLVSDIYDGILYKKQQCNSLSLNMNCDGLPIFKSGVSLWPIQLVLNELPPKLRKRNIILAGLWFGPTKPSMFTFLKPFAEEMQNLAENGIKWKIGDEVITTKVFLSLCALDSVARCQVSNMKQFNGEYGCGLCLNKGERVQKGKGHVRIYNHNDVTEQKRTDEQLRSHAAAAFAQGDDVFGVKGPSPLFNIPKFNIAEGFPPDPLHAIDLGVCRQVASLWFDSSNHNEEWYIGGSMEEMDRRMTSFHPPTEVTRTPHPVSDHSHWKGSEWRSWLLYYSLIVLKGILPSRFLTHWMLLVDSIYTLSKEKITQADFTRAAVSLNKFVIVFPQLYNRVHMSFNIHQLLHLVQCSRNWGPLWAFSSAWNEGYMASIKKLFHGTRAVPMQITTTFLSWQAATCLYKKSHRLDGLVRDFLDRNLIGHTNILKGYKVTDGVYMLGTCTYRKTTILESFAITQAIGISYEGHIKLYKKAIVNTICVHTSNYSRHTTRRNFCVQVTGDDAAFVQSFVVLEDGNQAFALINYVEYDGPFVKNRDRDSRADAGHIRVVKRVRNRLHAIPPSEIVGKHVVYERNGELITCHLPNLTERD